MTLRSMSTAAWALSLAAVAMLVAVIALGKGGMWWAAVAALTAGSWLTILAERRMGRRQR